MAEKQYVIFKLEKEEYGIDIMNVKEITEYKETTKIPNTPEFINGVINLRGNVIPIINLKKKFRLSEGGRKSSKRIIIVNVEDRQIGFMVDDASQVLALDEKNIEEPPELITGTDRRYIMGIGKVNDKIIVILNLASILSESEKKKIKELEI